MLSPRDFFYIPAGHDSWVVGEEPCVSLHILGSEAYAAPLGTRFGRCEPLDSRIAREH